MQCHPIVHFRTERSFNENITSICLFSLKEYVGTPVKNLQAKLLCQALSGIIWHPRKMLNIRQNLRVGFVSVSQSLSQRGSPSIPSLFPVWLLRGFYLIATQQLPTPSPI
jgi:hypothetical protein